MPHHYGGNLDYTSKKRGGSGSPDGVPGSSPFKAHSTALTCATPDMDTPPSFLLVAHRPDCNIDTAPRGVPSTGSKLQLDEDRSFGQSRRGRGGIGKCPQPHNLHLNAMAADGGLKFARCSAPQALGTQPHMRHRLPAPQRQQRSNASGTIGSLSYFFLLEMRHSGAPSSATNSR